MLWLSCLLFCTSFYTPQSCSFIIYTQPQSSASSQILTLWPSLFSVPGLVPRLNNFNTHSSFVPMVTNLSIICFRRLNNVQRLFRSISLSVLLPIKPSHDILPSDSGRPQASAEVERLSLLWSYLLWVISQNYSSCFHLSQLYSGESILILPSYRLSQITNQRVLFSHIYLLS